MRHVVGEGALRGRSPRTREGRIGPTAQLQWAVVRVGIFLGMELMADWKRLCYYLRFRKVRP